MSARIPSVLDLAEKIKGDIRQRRLRPGDAYLNTQEVARHFHVNGTTANRALQLLTQRGLLLRRQRMGTLVAAPARDKNAAPIACVHLFVHQQHLQSEGLLGDGTLIGLQRALPAAELQFNYPPPLEEVPYVEKVIAAVLRRRERAGFVLFRSSAAVQRLCESRGIPTVVSGTLQPAIKGLASIDRDQRQIGVLLAEHLLAQKCTRVAVFMRELQAAGDHMLLDAVFATLARARIKLDQVCVRCIGTDAATVQAEVAAILAVGKGSLGLLCRSEPLARSAAAACDALKLPAPRRPLIVAADFWRQGSNTLQFPHVASLLSPEDWGEKIGQMLLALIRKTKPAALQTSVPVRLVVPGAGAR